MKLFFLSNYDETLDTPTSTKELFVRSETVEAAIDLWREHFHTPDAEKEFTDEEMIVDEHSIPSSIWIVGDGVGVLAWHSKDGMTPVTTSRYHAVNEAREALGVA